MRGTTIISNKNSVDLVDDHRCFLTSFMLMQMGLSFLFSLGVELIIAFYFILFFFLLFSVLVVHYLSYNACKIRLENGFDI